MGSANLQNEGRGEHSAARVSLVINTARNEEHTATLAGGHATVGFGLRRSRSPLGGCEERDEVALFTDTADCCHNASDEIPTKEIIRKRTAFDRVDGLAVAPIS